MALPIAVGLPAPDFTLKDQNQQDVRLSQFRGQNVVLAFYPADFSPVCSQEHACFIDELKHFEGLKAQVLGLSVDNVWAHKAFANQLKISYPLLADFHPKAEVAKKFGLYLEDKGITNRAVVIVDKEGLIRFVKVYDITQAPDIQELVMALSQLK